MSSENKLMISPTVGLEATRVSDEGITEFNQAFTRLYKEQRQRTIGLLRQLPSVLEVIDRFVKGKSYEAVFPPGVRGELDKKADGLFGAIVRDSQSGQIICHVQLKEISRELGSSISQLALQHTLAEIVQRLEIIDQKITDLLIEVGNDRLALVESGRELYLQAVQATELATRHQLLIHAIGQLNEGRQKLILSLETDIEKIDNAIPRSFWDEWKLCSNPLKTIDNKARDVQRAFQAILRASYYLGSGYQLLDEPKSLQVSLQPLRDMLLKIGTKGEEIARWLPYDPSAPTEESWHSGLLQLADGILRTDKQLEQTDTDENEIVFLLLASEVTGGTNG